jgi:hypothetical protein
MEWPVMALFCDASPSDSYSNGTGKGKDSTVTITGRGKGLDYWKACISNQGGLKHRPLQWNIEGSDGAIHTHLGPGYYGFLKVKGYD